MLSWISRAVDGVRRAIGGAASSALHAVAGGLAGLLDIIFGNVLAGWDGMVAAGRDLVAGAEELGKALWRRMDEVIRYWIPTYAFTAWWWITHPDDLATMFGWHLVKWLEGQAWTVARYLGEFALAIVHHQLRRLLATAEDILHAVL